ncbi:MAG: Asp-tRNA(Asn)/Glu-tRNA(Gln) amidotransferase subunit GatB [Saprospiraceae bacterium]|nr:Asp-tRNA(Asn)/Glu-tRNA(Gln) amidotransferase subunit GatB [Saprospiraceae bacterium]MBP7699164.1 Asp-tRNA(Asn)/Glu-tRNA(Gln) amidotransferase subunit GatB [Saprospiraceae bacterium]
MNIMSYEIVIGLEVHIQLTTLSKAFCADNAHFGGSPNSHISAISLAHPGTLPRPNKKQLEYAVRLGIAMGSTINMLNTFDRKNYFYPDLPKGYQITQDKCPVCVEGGLLINVNGQEKYIRLHHIHQEEDAGKSVHDRNQYFSLIDLNRAGVPLLEIVTEPDFRSSEEVDAFMTAMRQLVRYLGISDGNMEEGSMRCDVNVSVRPKGQIQFGERCEIKNINSMRFARKAIEYEANRQIQLLQTGEKVIQQTRTFDPNTGTTAALRSKEDAHDYRYFPDPDLPPVIVTPEELTIIQNLLPQLPWQHKAKFINDYGLSEYDAKLLSEEREVAEYFLALCQQSTAYKPIANCIINAILPYVNQHKIAIAQFPVSQKNLLEFLQLIENEKVSNSIAYQQLFPALVTLPHRSPTDMAEMLDLMQTSNADELDTIIQNVLTQFTDKVDAYKKGKTGLLGLFVGEVMKQTNGKANPKMLNERILAALKAR